MTTFLTAVPAYGRDYKTKTEVLAAWNSGCDFQIQSYNSSAYVNKDSDLEGVSLTIRYSKLSKIVQIPSKK
jgi:hypothetical protein